MINLPIQSPHILESVLVPVPEGVFVLVEWGAPWHRSIIILLNCHVTECWRGWERWRRRVYPLSSIERGEEGGASHGGARPPPLVTGGPPCWTLGYRRQVGDIPQCHTAHHTFVLINIVLKYGCVEERKTIRKQHPKAIHSIPFCVHKISCFYKS